MADEEFSESDYKNLENILRDCESIATFGIGGTLFLGNEVYLAKKYTKLNPSKKFRIWLIDNGYLIDDDQNKYRGPKVWADKVPI